MNAEIRHMSPEALLRRAAERADADGVERALASGAKATAVGAKNRTPLMLAAASGCARAVRALTPLSDANHRDDQGLTALMLAIDGGHVECALALISLSDLKAKDRVWGRTALHWAAAGAFRLSADPQAAANSKKMVEALALEGVDTTDKDGRTPLMLAAKAGLEDCVNTLLARGAFLLAQSPDGASAMTEAARARHEPLALKMAALIDDQELSAAYVQFAESEAWELVEALAPRVAESALGGARKIWLALRESGVDAPELPALNAKWKALQERRAIGSAAQLSAKPGPGGPDASRRGSRL
jgi:hypothetical protein